MWSELGENIRRSGFHYIVWEFKRMIILVAATVLPFLYGWHTLKPFHPAATSMESAVFAFRIIKKYFKILKLQWNQVHVHTCIVEIC